MSTVGTGPLLVIGVLCGALAGCLHQIGKLRRQRDALLFTLQLLQAQRAGEAYLRELLTKWEQHVASEDLEFGDGEDVAHAFADFLANATGEAIIVQQQDGEGLVVAIPDEEQPDA